MEHVSCSMGFPVSDMQMDIVGHMSNNSSSQGFSGPSEQMGVVEPISLNPMFNPSSVSNTDVPNFGSSGGDTGFSSIWMSADLVNDDPVILSSIPGHEKPLPVKRKSDMGFNSYNFVSEQQIFPDAISVHSGNGFGLSGVMKQPAQRRTLPVSPSSGFPGLHPQSNLIKKTVRDTAVAGRSYLKTVQPVNKQHPKLHSSSKTKHESSESIRSKMRESLAAALALTSANSDKVLENKKEQDSATRTNDAAVESNDSGLSKGRNISSEAEEIFSPKELSVTGSTGDSHVLPAEFSSHYSNLNGGGTFHEFQYTSMLVDDDSQFSDSFFVKDDLLQGNGLSWALDFDVQMNDGKETQSGDDLNSTVCEGNEHEEKATVEVFTPDVVAFNIEAELFRQFSGVNKKYKEKGRSLLFNLKDRNNPELRERVMSGEISPERLCAMSAEELASKELSEWRMAKAEELAQMKVLPDVDIRNLVRKTHKGEYQVEIQRDDNVVADLSGGTSILTQRRPKKDIKSDSPSKESLTAGDGSNINVSENQDNLDSLVIPADGADLMQKIMVEEMKNPKIPPPIVSLDEFMESLNSEPPFEKLSSDADNNATDSRERSRALSKSTRASNKDSDANKFHEANTAKRSRESPKQKVVSSISAEEVRYAWEGVLQFNNSSSVTVCGLYQSGEKASTKQWPSSLDIKGRVRLGAFEKFVQDLPMSRTRAVMVLKLELKDKSSKVQLTTLSEAIGSYSAEDRLGYAEPMPGVEIYLCPWTPRVTEMVKYYVPKESIEISSEDGLIGVVVWRRAKSSKQISPNSPSHLKHSTGTSSSSKKQAVIHVRSHDSKVKNMSSKSGVPLHAPSVLSNVTRSKPEHEPEKDDDDEIPPGFGPSGEDDLPEFCFTSQMNNLNHNHNTASLTRILPVQDQFPIRRQVDKVRELIQKYGQSDSSSSSNVNSRMSSIDDRSHGSGFEPWNDDEDDDDIPEWKPQFQQVYNSNVVEQQVPSGRWVQMSRMPQPPGSRWRPY